MQSCSSSKTPIVKGDRFSKAQCPQNVIERDRMKAVLYSLVVGSLMYAQVCIHPDIAFVVSLLGRYFSDPGQSHWKMAKKVLRYLPGTKDLMLTYQRTDTLEVVGFSDSDYAGYVDDKKSTSGYIRMSQKMSESNLSLEGKYLILLALVFGARAYGFCERRIYFGLYFPIFWSST